MRDQEKVNEVFHQVIKPEWNKLVSESGKSEQEFIATEAAATEFLTNYKMTKAICEKQGFTMPELVPSL